MDMATNYAKDILINMSDEGMNEELWELAHRDVGVLSELEANSDRERNLYFYLDNFYDDLIEEFGTKKDVPKEKVLTCAFAKLRNKKEIDLTDVRRAVYEALQSKEKRVAYPNNIGVRSFNKKPPRDISKWISALGSIYAAMKKGKGRDEATKQVTEGWDPMEKFDFEGWARYYEHGDQEKYNLQKSAAEFAPPSIPFKENIFEEEAPKPEVKLDPRQEQKMELAKPRRPGRPRKVERTQDDSKRALISRLDSARKLLREFANVWPVDKWTHLDEMLSFLQREIIPLKTATTIIDCIIRTANKLEKEGFDEGAYTLRKIAQPPTGDVASQIEKALTGREYENKNKKEGPPMEEMMGGMEEMPPPPEMPPEEEAGGVPAGVEEELPPPEAPPPAAEEEPSVATEGGPFEGKTVKDVLNILEPLASKLSEREFVRELSKADMMLDGLNIASHFPELGEAQAKALELNLYVSARIEKIINKLKGGLKEEKEEGEGAPSIEMKEAPKEEEMFEIEEETAPTPAETAVEMAMPSKTRGV
jgi:hypothetical protein